MGEQDATGVFHKRSNPDLTEAGFFIEWEFNV